MKKEVGPGKSALILFARSDDERRTKVIERMNEFKPKMIESDMPDDVEREVTRALEHEQTAPTLAAGHPLTETPRSHTKLQRQ